MDKKIREIVRLSKLLPVSYEYKKKSYWPTGKEIVKNRKRLGFTRAQIKELKKQENWQTKKFKVRNLYTYEKINHRRKLLRAYAKGGVEGMHEYNEWLLRNNEANERRGYNNKASNYNFAMGLLRKLVKAGPKGMWAAIAMFIAAWFTAFGGMNIEEEE